MEQYYFLFGLGLIWIIFAVVQDMRTTEVSNWLNFSLIAFVLGYRAIYASVMNDLMFFVYGFFGVLFFVVLAYAFYYGRVFAGGDAKLLMGIGGILPFEMFRDYWLIGGGFILLLFTAGVIWTLLFSFYLVSKNKKKFGKAFKKQLKNNKAWLYVGLAGFIIVITTSFFLKSSYFVLLGVMIVFFPVLIIYVKAIEKSCMMIIKKPGELIEGDWIEKDVKIGGRVIKKTVHGLSKKDIALLKKHKKKVLVKNGVPFTPAFLIGYLVLFYLLWF